MATSHYRQATNDTRFFLPSVHGEEDREPRASFIASRPRKTIPDFEDDHGGTWNVYYKVDAGDSFTPSTFELRDDEVFNSESADKFWDNMAKEQPNLIQDLIREFGLPAPEQANDEEDSDK